MRSPTDKEKRATEAIVPPKETQWEFIMDVLRRVERLEQRSDSLVYERQIDFSMVPIISLRSETWAQRLGIEFALGPLLAEYLVKKLGQGPESVTSDYPIEMQAKNVESHRRSLTSAAEAFVQEFGNPLARIHRHTDLCQASRKLREAARVNRNTPFYWAIVELDDCTRATAPEDMTPGMARTLFACSTKLSPSMTEEEMLVITDELYDAGFRPWRPRRKRHTRKRARPVPRQ
ncbi:hypothetical protein FJY63_11185 [Candidatus Sumerlaeota bacterium]|nr:hypothetical protein [Candidatus Sumerlaeota bacterium]